jgi:hypothetical protein
MFGRKRTPPAQESQAPALTLPAVRMAGAADPIHLVETPAPAPAPAPAPEADGLGGVVDRLARLGGRRAKAAAERLLVEQGSLALGEARREEEAAKRQARGDARRAWLEALAPGIVYTLAIGFAAGGQVTGIALRLQPHGLIATLAAIAAGIGAAGLIEGNGLAFAILARRAALAGQRAYAARSMMYLSTAAACALNCWGHWGSVWVYPCSLGSVVALVLWVVETAHRCAAQLAEAKAALKRHAAIRALARTAVRRSHGRRIAGIVTATMDPATMEQLAVAVVNPMAVAETAISRYVAGKDRTANGGAWWRFWRRSSTPPAPRHVTATRADLAGQTAPLCTATQTATGGQMAALDTATNDEYWRDMERDLAAVSTANVAGTLAAETPDLADQNGGLDGGDPWRYASALVAGQTAPDQAATETATQRATERSSGGPDSDDVADMATARKSRTRRQDKRGGKAAKRGAAERVEAVWRRDSNVTAAECVRRARVGRRTAERHLADLRRNAADMAEAN